MNFLPDSTKASAKAEYLFLFVQVNEVLENGLLTSDNK
jgi:hypothetical protein